MSASRLVAVLCVVALSHGLPQEDAQSRLDRPSSPEPPTVKDCALEVQLAAIYNTAVSPECGGAPVTDEPDHPVTPSQPPPPTPTTPTPVDGECQCVPFYQCKDNNNINTDGEDIIDIRIRECDDYLMKCCGGANGSSTIVPPTVPPTRPIRDDNTCGHRNNDGVGFRITGDKDNEAQYGEFPWMVAIIRPEESLSQGDKTISVYQCGGSLIHPQVVLTGAHCVHGKSNLIVRAGEWDTQTKNELYPYQDRKVQEVIVHEQFNNKTLSFDPALLILDTPVDMRVESVGLICLPEAGEKMDGRQCVASGWGKDLFGKEGQYQVILKKIELPIVPNGKCQESLRKTRLGQHFNLHKTFICAGGVLGKDTCKGDGGSPLVCPSKGNPEIYVQAGIVAWGIGCGTEAPGVYVDVAGFVNWIHNKLEAHDITLNQNHDG